MTNKPQQILFEKEVVPSRDFLWLFVSPFVSAVLLGDGGGKMFHMDSLKVLLYLRSPIPPNKEACDKPALKAI